MGEAAAAVGHASTGDNDPLVDCAISSSPRVVSIDHLFRHSDPRPGSRTGVNQADSVFSYEALMKTR